MKTALKDLQERMDRVKDALTAARSQRDSLDLQLVALMEERSDLAAAIQAIKDRHPA